MLKKLAKYLRSTKHWGLHYHRQTLHDTLPPCPIATLSADAGLPAFPALDPGTRLTCFLDAAHANDLRQRRSTTGYAFLMSGASISYKCKTQTTTATSSTEAEFYAAVSAAKHACYLRAILTDLGFPQDAPTPLYCDNQSAINMINAKIPTERSHHILIQFFAIQDWKDLGDIILRFIPGIINPSDDLTKPLGWVLHARHSRRLMGHLQPSVPLFGLISTSVVDQGKVSSELGTPPVSTVNDMRHESFSNVSKASQGSVNVLTTTKGSDSDEKLIVET